MNKLYRLFLLPWLCLALQACSGFGGGNQASFSYKLLPVKKDGKWGYIDHTGKYAINPQFASANLFSDGLALVQNAEDKWGYIDADGRFAIAPAYKAATHFTDGLAMAVLEDGHPTCINKQGKAKFVLKDADEANAFQDGLALVKVDGRIGYIDAAGRIVITPQFYRAGDFRDGRAVYGVKSSADSTVIIYGFIDKSGKIVVNAQFTDLSMPAGGAALAKSSDSKYGFIDLSGRYIINPQFDDAGSFSEDLAPVKVGKSWGYVDKDGKMVINPQFDEAGLFHHGLAAVRSGEDQWGYINKEGKIMINPQFKTADGFHDGFALVASGANVGLIDEDGKYAVNPQFEAAGNMIFKSFYPIIDFGPAGGVTSDYFDKALIAQKIVGDVSGNRMRGIGHNTTYQGIMSMVPGTATEANYAQEVTDGSTYPVLPGVGITNSEYHFEEPLYTYNTTDYSKIYNQQNRLNRAVYTIKLDAYGRTREKAVRLGEAIRDLLIRKAHASRTGTDENSTAEKRALVSDFYRDHNNAKETGWYLYGQHTDYLVYCDIANNALTLYAIFKS